MEREVESLCDVAFWPGIRGPGKLFLLVSFASGLPSYASPIIPGDADHASPVQSILIVGTGDSAIDISLQALPYAKGPIYVSQRTPHRRHPTVFSRPNIEVVTTISHLTEDTIYLSDGKTLTNIDNIVFATGYIHSYPFLPPHVRPPTVAGRRIAGLYQHIFDTHNPDLIAFNGVIDGLLPWITWEKSAFLIALLWSGKIHLPPKEAQEEWEARRLAVTGDDRFHVLDKIPDQVVYFDELNELAAEYLHTGSRDDILLRSFPFGWVLDLFRARDLQAKAYALTDKTQEANKA